MVSKRHPPFSRNGCCVFPCFSGEPLKLAGELCLHGYSSTTSAIPWLKECPGALGGGNSALKSRAGQTAILRGKGHRQSGNTERNNFCSSLELCITGTGTANVPEWAVVELFAWLKLTGLDHKVIYSYRHPASHSCCSHTSFVLESCFHT